MNRARFLILYAIAFLLPWGTFDVFLLMGFPFSLVECLIAAFIFMSFIVSLTNRHYVGVKDYFLLTPIVLVLVLAIASHAYPAQEPNGVVVNFKLLILGVFFIFSVLGIQNYFSKNEYTKLLNVFLFGGALFLTFLILFGDMFSTIQNGRLIFNGENPNSIAARLTLVAVIAINNLVSSENKKYLIKGLLFIVFCGCFFIIFQTGSRGALLSLVLSALIMFLFSDFSKSRKSLIIVVFSSVVLMIAPILGQMDELSIIARIENTMRTGDTGGRFVIWSSAVNIFFKSPIIGVGEYGYMREISGAIGYRIDAHNLFVYLAATSGLVGLTIFCAFFLRVCHSAYNAFRGGYLLPSALLFNLTILALKTGGVLTYFILWFFLALLYVEYRRLPDHRGRS